MKRHSLLNVHHIISDARACPTMALRYSLWRPPSFTHLSVYSIHSINNPHVFNCPTERRQLSDRSLGIFFYFAVWGRRVHQADRHRVSAYYTGQLIFIKGSPVGFGPLESQPLCRVVCAVQCVVVCVVLSVLDILGEILWSIISSYYERLSVESRVLDRGAPRRCRHCCCWRVIAASLYYTEKRVVLGLGVWIVWGCFMCVVAAELRLPLLHASAELCSGMCAVRCATLWNKMPGKALLPNNITSILLYVLGRKSVHVLILGKNIFHAGRYIFWHHVRLDRFFFLLPKLVHILFVVLNVSIILRPRV